MTLEPMLKKVLTANRSKPSSNLKLLNLLKSKPSLILSFFGCVELL